MTKTEIEEMIAKDQDSTETPPRTVEPGEVFKVGYGNGRTVDVVGLSVRQKKKLMSAYLKVAGAGQSEDQEEMLKTYDYIVDALKISVPDATDEWIDTLSDVMCDQIVSRHLSGQALSEEDRKKSE